MANRCSIEMEPKTLNEGQLNQAREVAIDIVLNQETYEASNIMRREGVKAVLEENLIAESKAVERCNEIACQCSLTSSIIDSPVDNPKLKEPLSAPF